MGKHQLKELAKIIDYILLHRPDEFGLFPEDDGSLPIKDLLWALHEEPGWSYVRPSHLKELAYSGIPVNFSLHDAHLRPSSSSPFVLAASTPPRFLFHGARRQAYPVILKHGLRPGARAHVALATTEEMALRIGRRRDEKPVLLTVHATRAHEAGSQFLRCGELLYLVNELAVNFLSGPPPDQVEAPVKEAKKPPEAPGREIFETPGSFFLDPARVPDPGRVRPRSGGKKDVDWKRQVRRERRRRKRGEFS
jgi:putative RNA 2'-phosphotransferase